MDRRKFLVRTAMVGAGTAAIAVSGTASAATCEATVDDLYRPPGNLANRLIYPAQAGETPTPTDLKWPPGHPWRYLQ